MADVRKSLLRKVTIEEQVDVAIPEHLFVFLQAVMSRHYPLPAERLPGPLSLFDARIVLSEMSFQRAAADYGVSNGRLMVAFSECFDQFSDDMTLDTIINTPEPK